jgi:hypothetical protein
MVFLIVVGLILMVVGAAQGVGRAIEQRAELRRRVAADLARAKSDGCGEVEISGARRYVALATKMAKAEGLAAVVVSKKG